MTFHDNNYEVLMDKEKDELSFERKQELLFANEDETETLSGFIRKQSKKLANADKGLDKTFYPQELIAELLDISVTLLRKKIYHPKNLSRDWLIAICAAYGMDSGATSEALSICNMPTIDDTCKREQAFVYILDSHRDNTGRNIPVPISLQDFNSKLRAMQVPELAISSRNRSKNLNRVKPNNPYEVIKPEVVYVYEKQMEYPVGSLALQYQPNMKCVGMVLLKKDNVKYLFEVRSDESCWISTETDDFPRRMENIDQTNPLYTYYCSLQAMVKTKKQSLDEVIRDSKNYPGRYGANIKDDSLHVYYEEFNYDYPERNEYYLMEYLNDKFILSIAHESMFLQEHLSQQQYLKHFHSIEPIRRKSYSSVEEIKNTFPEHYYYYPELKKSRIYAFRRLQRVVEEKIELIRNRKVFICEYDEGDPLFELIQIYHLEKEFDFKMEDDESGLNVTCKDEISIELEDGNSISIGIFDLKTGFELGVMDVQEIARLKWKYGSLDVFFSY